MSRDRERLDEIGKKIKTDAGGEMGRRHLLGPPGTLNTITPCAACKLLRRRCAEECPFSPYFSPHEPHKFAAVHKVFGASNVSKMLMEVPENQRADAANSLVYEANLRLRDPVYGCMGAIVTLQQQMQNLQAELNAIRAEILKYKIREVTNNNILPSTHPHTHTHTHATLVSGGAVSVAASSSPLPPPPSIVVSTSSSSSASSLYTSATSATGYSSISSDNVPFFN
ncbi:LOB domain-containing protein 15 [Gossypium arboreum]|uniref:LOB domain-containing protein n=1 Tax=Gossypium arboreum TaxID=29729 RepID=A0ABR0R5X5_GOSAR|nr:LOB domain-containing protein 15 [Gossypium arboreum]KAK5847005.1 hypothetical protein PVK06_003306 [Gossypium arboreum]